MAIDYRSFIAPEAYIQNKIATQKRVGTFAGFEKWREDAIHRFLSESERRREELFEAHHPYSHHARLLHPDPLESRDVARAALAIRRLGWRGVEWVTSLKALDLDNFVHVRWLYSVRSINWAQSDLAWDITVPHQVPEGIPHGVPDDELIQNWNPHTTVWDLQDAAMHELEIGMGGAASVLLHDRLTVAQDLLVGSVKVPGLTTRNAARTRVTDYLKYYLAFKTDLNWPDDPYDPNNWGHDSKLKSLVIRDGSTNEDIELTPTFDPDVLAYTIASQPTTLPAFNATARDPLRTDSAMSIQFFENYARFTVTVTAADGTSTVYEIRVASSG